MSWPPPPPARRPETFDLADSEDEQSKLNAELGGAHTEAAEAARRLLEKLLKLPPAARPSKS